jgi:NAD(P)H dehydrogenase (quinone)
VLKRVPETVPPEVAREIGAKLDQQATPEKLSEYDGIIFGPPLR